MYDVNSSIVDTSDFTPNPIWTPTSPYLTSQEKDDRVPFEDTTNKEILLVSFMTRKPLYYMMNYVFPGFLLNIVTLLSFFMPASAGTGIVMSGFITFGVYSVNTASTLPTQSDYIPKISNYFLSSIALNFIAFAWFLYMNRCLLRSEMPACLKMFGEKVKKIFCLCFPPEVKKDQKPSGKDNVDDLMSKKQTEGDTLKLDVLVAETPKLPDTKESKTDDNKIKCGLCDRCIECQADFKKDKDKGKMKKEIESSFEALNWLAFWFMFTLLIITNIAVWVKLYN